MADERPNYLIARGNFGGYKHPDVIPYHAAEAAGNHHELVEKGVLVPTTDPVTVAQVRRPAADPLAAPETVYDERNRFAQKANDLETELRRCRGEAEESRRLADGFRQTCDAYTAEKASLAAAHKSLQERFAECEAERRELAEECESLKIAAAAAPDAHAEIGRVTADRDALKAKCDTLEADVDRLTAELDEATSPKK